MRSLLRLSALIMAVCLLGGCGSKQKDAVELIKERGVLVAAVPKERPGTGQYESELERRVLKALADELSVELRCEETKDTGLREAVENGSADLAAGVAALPDSRNAGYSVLYGRKAVFIATTGEKRYSSVNDLSGSGLGFSGAVGEEVRNQFYLINDVTMTDYGDAESAESDLRSRRMAAYICYEDEARLLLEHGITVRDIPEAGQEACAFAVGEGQPELLGLINQLLTEELMKR